MPRYEVVKMSRGHVASHWNGDKATGGRTTLFLGAIVDMPEDVAKKYGDSLKRIDGGARSKTGDVPLPEDVAQHTPPVATRTVPITPDVPPPGTAPVRATTPSTEPPAVTDDDLEDLLGDPAPAVVETVKAIDDEGQLKSLRAAEKKGKNRVSVVNAIEQRLDDIKA